MLNPANARLLQPEDIEAWAASLRLVQNDPQRRESLGSKPVVMLPCTPGRRAPGRSWLDWRNSCLSNLQTHLASNLLRLALIALLLICLALALAWVSTGFTDIEGRVSFLLALTAGNGTACRRLAGFTERSPPPPARDLAGGRGFTAPGSRSHLDRDPARRRVCISG